MIKQNQKYINRFVVLIDALCVFASLIIAWYIRFDSGWIVSEEHLTFSQYIRPFILVVPLYIFLYNIFNLYIPQRIRGLKNEIFSIIKANMIGILIFIVGLYVFKNIDYSRFFLFIFFFSSMITTSCMRIIIRYTARKFRRKGYNLKHVIIVGISELAVEFIRMIDSNRHWGYNVIGILDDNRKLGYRIRGKEVLGSITQLKRFLEEFDIDEVFITLELKEYEKLGQIIETSEKVGVRTQIIPDYYKYIPAKPYVEEVGGLPIINIRYVPLDNIINRIIKRIFDIVASLICIVLFSPIMVLTTIIIKITSPGPVLFKQERVGLNKKNFMMYKFRSMKIQKEEEEKNQWTTKDDPRKTRFGNFIRKTSIDELPQLFNVLKGDMSLIGPRPERPYFVGQFKEEIPKYMIKHQVRPGMTGWAQINGYRGDTSINGRIEHDLYYIENWTFGLDVKILWLTLFRGFVNKNAY